MPPTLSLDSPVTDIKKIQASTADALRRMGVETVRDLLLTLPFDWRTFGEPVPVAALTPGQEARVTGTLVRLGVKRSRYQRIDLTEGTLVDSQGGHLKVVWFRMPWIGKDYKAGDMVALAGKPRLGYSGLEMQNPHVSRLGTGPREHSLVRDMIPKYHLSGKIRSEKVAELVGLSIKLADGIEDTLPEAVRFRRGLLPVAEAVRQGHQPESWEQWNRAVARMAFAELFELQVAFSVVRRRLESERADPIPYRQDVIDTFKSGLEFELTRAQKRSLWEVFQDLAGDRPMNRLLNGDVGSGKTAVAAGAAAMAHAAGMQTVVMAPTEILARQHLQKFRAYLESSFPGLTVELLVGGLPAAERRRVRTAAASGHCALLVGTHALIEEQVELANLGLAVVDEQHRFGTRQRELLRSKGRGRPHFLAMTATPIPRTLALALYGEMTVSVIDELPPGRTPVATQVIPPGRRQVAYDLVRREVEAGRQAFVICPLVEESEKLEAKAATVEFERLQKDVFPDLKLELVHGKMRDKDRVMRGFAAGDSDVLVATAVVEVGVDVPNATVMLIEGAERFGLAQLHQFRGRVGRGAAASHCLLVESESNEVANQRLAYLAENHDGFRIAEYDMKMRGIGELMGPRQHGLTDQAMDALSQPQLLSEVRQEADAVLAEDPELERVPALRERVLRRLDLTSIS